MRDVWGSGSTSWFQEIGLMPVGVVVLKPAGVDLENDRRIFVAQLAEDKSQVGFGREHQASTGGTRALYSGAGRSMGCRAMRPSVGAKWSVIKAVGGVRPW